MQRKRLGYNPTVLGKEPVIPENRFDHFLEREVIKIRTPSPAPSFRPSEGRPGRALYDFRGATPR